MHVLSMRRSVMWYTLSFSQSSVVSRRVWYHALSLCYARIRRSDIILTPRLPVCQISFLLHPIAELAHGEKSRTQSVNHSLSHSPSLFSSENDYTVQEAVIYKYW